MMEYHFIRINRRLGLEEQTEFLNGWTQRGYRVHSCSFEGAYVNLLIEWERGNNQIQELQREFSGAKNSIGALEKRIDRLVAVLSPEQELVVNLDEEALLWAFKNTIPSDERDLKQLLRVENQIKRAHLTCLSELATTLKSGGKIRNLGDKGMKIAWEMFEAGTNYLEEQKALTTSSADP